MNPERPIPLRWFKSTHSGDEGGECVEIAVDRATIHVRDSKSSSGPRLAFAHGTWAGFVADLGWDRSA
ncbi:DUF397 domain-containing protein [Streptomyces tsukubensis]|uniref:DUF397 domain-containing protein n=1 Tax=Streptomyces tsukubensis TaxID=83656 RepID=A0A1V4AE72_9ACTN|nr:DUF397 domain-containing protein [Streptomyces tsukubensis]OON81796.1 DUF397 domain-containing protein [Streptomyces tsukubensis]QFR96585.1 DUF397 domain-containing protein [Streptomyces tsukubensis]